MLSLVYCTDPLINTVSEKVEHFDESLSSLVSDMFSLLKIKGGVGLAAIQVGVPLRLFITDTGEEAGRLVFINPEIIATSDDREPYNEGCLSVPKVYRDVYRPSKVKIQAFDVNGKRFAIDADGLLARVIQHENDHLDGKLFISHLSEDERHSALKEFKKENKMLLKHLKKEGKV